MERAPRCPSPLTLLLAIAWLLGSSTLVGPRSASAEITPDAQKVVDRYLSAIGGAPATRGVTTSHYRGKIEAFGLTGAFESWHRRPDATASLTGIGPIELRSAYDGKIGWHTDATGKASVLDGKDLEEKRAEVWFDNDQWLMPDQGGGKVAVVADSATGFTVLEATPPVGRSRRLYFDRANGLLERVIGKHDQQTVTDIYSDYRPVARTGKPRLVPWVQHTSVEGMAANDITATLESVTDNEPMADSLFAMPSSGATRVSYLKTPGTARLPFEYLGKHVWLRASVNGQPPADFLFDTGASITVIDSSYADKIGLAREGALSSTGAGASGAASLSSLTTLRVVAADGDGVEMQGQKVAILSVNPFLAPFFWRDCAGIVGYDFISRFVDRIDYDHQLLTLSDPATFHYAGKGAALPMRLAGTVPVVTMKLDDQYEGEFRLDVGSSSTVDLHTPFVEAHHLRQQTKRSVDALGGGFGGMFTSTLTRMKKLAVGPYSWPNPLVSLSSTTVGALASEDYAGNAGNQILERFTVTLDYEHKTVYLEPGARYGKRDVFTRTGTQLARFGDSVRAMQVLKGSPAEKAGIVEGDEIVSVAGKPITTWKPQELDEYFEKRPVGTPVAVVVLRDGKQKTLSLKLEDML